MLKVVYAFQHFYIRAVSIWDKKYIIDSNLFTVDEPQKGKKKDIVLQVV